MRTEARKTTLQKENWVPGNCQSSASPCKENEKEKEKEKEKRERENERRGR